MAADHRIPGGPKLVDLQRKALFRDLMNVKQKYFLLTFYLEQKTHSLLKCKNE